MAVASATAEEREALQQRRAAIDQQVEQLSTEVSFPTVWDTGLGLVHVLKGPSEAAVCLIHRAMGAAFFLPHLRPFGGRSTSQTLLLAHCMS